MAEENKEKETEEEKDREEKEEENKQEENKKDKEEEKKEESKKEDQNSGEVPAKFKSIVEEIEKLSVVDLADLVHVLENRFGVSAAVPATASGTVSESQEKSEYNVILQSVGDQKINVIKVVKEVTGSGLKEAKDLVDNAPRPVKEGVKKEEAEEIKKKLEEVGATVSLE